MKIKIASITSFVAIVALGGCATTKESVSWESKKGVTVVHHRRRTSSGLVDRIDALGKNGVVSRAEIHVYDVGRYIDSNGNMHEAHQVYRVAQSSRPLLTLPKGTHPTGPRTVYTPPNYTPTPNDQRINDAITEARKAKEKPRPSGNRSRTGWRKTITSVESSRRKLTRTSDYERRLTPA